MTPRLCTAEDMGMADTCCNCGGSASLGGTSLRSPARDRASDTARSSATTSGRTVSLSVQRRRTVASPAALSAASRIRSTTTGARARDQGTRLRRVSGPPNAATPRRRSDLVPMRQRRRLVDQRWPPGRRCTTRAIRSTPSVSASTTGSGSRPSTPRSDRERREAGGTSTRRAAARRIHVRRKRTQLLGGPVQAGHRLRRRLADDEQGHSMRALLR